MCIPNEVIIGIHNMFTVLLDGRMVPLVTGYDLQEVMQALWDNDVSRIPETDYVLNLQSRTNLSNKIDMADSR